MRTLIIALALGARASTLSAQAVRHIDVENLFPSVGTAIIWVEPNGAGVPPGVLAAGSGVLIGDRVFLTAAHVTRPAEDGIPPFIHVYVTFNLHVFDDRSTWIPVVAQAWHPSTPPCHNNVCDWQYSPTQTFSDVGLMLLESAPKGIKPAELARAGSIETGRGDSQDQIIVGYGFPDMARPWSQWPGVRHYVVVPPEQVLDDRRNTGGSGQICLGDSGGPTFFGPIGDSGQKRREVLAVTSATVGGCSTASIFARVDNADVLAWISQQVQQWAAK
jgi:hypothetical protein